MAKRRGRKLKPGARYANGRLKPQEKPDTVAKEARQRIFGVTAEIAGKREMGSAIGKLLLLGELKQDQFEALEQFGWAEREYQASIDIRRERSASDFSGSGGFDSREGDDPWFVQWCETRKERYTTLRNIVLKSGPLGMMAVESWVLSDGGDGDLIGDLRLAANAINRAMKKGLAA